MRVALGLMMAAVTIGTAGAQVTAEQHSAIRANCRSDFMSKCSGVTPGGKEALQCLQKNVAALSAGCKTAVSATLPEPAPAAAASAPPKPAAAPKVEAAAPPAATPTAPAATAPATTAAPSTAPAAAPAAPAAANVAPKPAEAAKPRTATRPPANPPSASPPAGSGAKTAAAPPASAPPAATPPTAAPDKPVVNAAVVLRACKLDLVRHCGDVAFGEGRKLACLSERAENLTMRCRTALKVSAPVR